MLRRPLLAMLVPALLLAACGEDEGTPDASDTTESAAAGCPSADVLDAVEVSGEAGVAPVLEFDQPLAVETTACRVLEEGDGDAVAEGSTAIFHFVFINGRDGSEVTSSYDTDPAEVVFNDELLGGVRTALDGVKVGSRVLVAISPDDGFGPQGGDPANGVEADDTLLFVLDLLEVRTPLERAEGTEVDPVDGQPTVELDEDGAPTITVPDTDPPAELIAQPLIEGEGDVVESGQTITVHYTGVLWDTGEVFDSSWEGGSPVSFPIGTGGVIPGWDKGLVGQPIGSQVLLVIPPADGYGEQGSGDAIPPGATLVFVVDILDAHS
jgi:peptidylprolyl isomerase